MTSFPPTFFRLIRPNFAWVSILACICLTVMGIMAIHTAEYGAGTNHSAVQAQWLIISLVGMILCALPHPRIIAHLSYPIFTVFLVILFVQLLPFTPHWLVPPRNGARSWINLYFMMFQPGEVAKVIAVLALSHYLRFRSNYRTLKGLLLPFGIMFLPMGLILKQPDLGMCLMFPPALFSMLVAAGAKLRHLFALVGITVLAMTLTVAAVTFRPDIAGIFLKPHQLNRLKAMVSMVQGDNKYVNDIGYQQDKAMTLAGAGGFSGYGGEESARIVRYNRLPEAHNDMIFAVIVNRWGTVGGLVALSLFLLLITSMLIVAAGTADPFARLASVGLAWIFFAQVTVNVGMTIGLMPIAGITLPFVSYGGSSLLTSYCTIGLVLNFASRDEVLFSRPSFEFDKADSYFERRVPGE